MNAEKFLMRLTLEGGIILSQNDCSPIEIAIAKQDMRWFVDQNDCGYVLRPRHAISYVGTAHA